MTKMQLFAMKSHKIFRSEASPSTPLGASILAPLPLDLATHIHIVFKHANNVHLNVVVFLSVLRTCATVVELERTAHGPFSREMCVPAYEWTLDSVRRAIALSRCILERQQFGQN